MRAKGKTKAERENERAALERRAWEDFRPKLEALSSFADAMLLVHSAPRPDSPGRCFYSNLGYFLGEFSVPDGSSGEERGLYLEFLERLNEKGELKPDAGAEAIRLVRESITNTWN